MTSAEFIASVKNNLETDPEDIRALVICRGNSVEMVGHQFCAEMIVGQLHRMCFEVQFAAMTESVHERPTEPEYLTDKIRADLDKLAIGH